MVDNPRTTSHMPPAMGGLQELVWEEISAHDEAPKVWL
jgi:hypothetical protein